MTDDLTRFREMMGKSLDRHVSKGKPEECWEWQGYRNSGGYGILTIHGKTYRAHRVAYEAANGSIPANLMICHSCDNRRCCNPAHLWAGTCADNMRDCKEKGRLVLAKYAPGMRRVSGVEHGRSKLTEEQVRFAILEGANISCSELARRFGVDRTAISQMRHRKTWNALREQIGREQSSALARAALGETP